MPITGGKLYGSRASAFRAQIQGRNPIRWNAIGSPIEWTKELTAEFAYHGGEVQVFNTLENRQDTGAVILGNAFDSAAQAEEKNWTQEEHDLVVQELDRLCEVMPGEVWVITAPKAEKPWPKYDDTHHNQIPVLADQLGNADVALTYERQNKNRPAVVEKLEEILVKQQSEQELTAA